ncbi:RidA family protein [Halobacillus naozhouensis]|uniref:RidA family protein n=2 Tax=Halobacillus naozhouensis TaxID=554880 RepID=A0ABY8J0N2_9BACI|nr:RidA family protein [Halobacillus naozhouensis]WFT75607.1 RidA family protein [Halobacillus naozhouensis]
MEVEDKLHSLGLCLPDLPKPSGHYLGAVKVDKFLFISGVTCKRNGELLFKGQVGSDLSIEDGYEAAKITTLNHLSIIQDMLGGFDQMDRIVKLTGYVNSTDGFGNVPDVINGSSDFLVNLFGEYGKHARCAVGVSSLPGNAAVETDLLLSIK